MAPETAEPHPHSPPHSSSGKSSLARQVIDSLFAVIFPSACSVCGRELTVANHTGVCAECWQGVQPWTGPICQHCGLPFASPRSAEAVLALCGMCRTEQPPFDGARTYGLYRGALRSLILQLKFRRRERLGIRLGARLAAAWLALDHLKVLPTPLIVPVPLHSLRQWERGFNQAQVLAEGLQHELRRQGGRRYTPAVDAHCLRRIRATPPQTGLTLTQRLENVRGVFAVASPARLEGRTVIVVDDVMTTGATVSACARALKKAGAEQVWALTLARATPEFPDTGIAEVALPVDGRVIE